MMAKSDELQSDKECEVCGGRASACRVLGHRPASDRTEWQTSTDKPSLDTLAAKVLTQEHLTSSDRRRVAACLTSAARRADESTAPSAGVRIDGIEECARIVDRKGQDLTNEYCHGDAGPDGYTWTNKEAEWQVILLGELADEFRALKNATPQGSASPRSQGGDAAARENVASCHAGVASSSGVATSEPVAFVPIHPRTGPLWANTIPSRDYEHPAHYELMPLYSSPPSARERVVKTNADGLGECPMCGLAYKVQICQSGDGKGYVVECGGCGLTTGHYHHRDFAAAMWNSNLSLPRSRRLAESATGPSMDNNSDWDEAHAALIELSVAISERNVKDFHSALGRMLRPSDRGIDHG